MLGLFRSARMSRTPVASRSARPMLEQLEGRAAPANLTLDVSYGLGTQVTLSGDLTDTPVLANQVIEIDGAVSGTTFTDSTGHFALTVEATTLGDVYADAPDLECNTPWVELTDEVPELTAFEAIEDALQAELQSEVAPLTAGEGGGGLGVTLSVLGQDRRHGPQDRLLQVALITVFPCILVPSVF